MQDVGCPGIVRLYCVLQCKLPLCMVRALERNLHRRSSRTGGLHPPHFVLPHLTLRSHCRSELMELYRLHLQQSDMPTDFGTLLQLRCLPPGAEGLHWPGELRCVSLGRSIAWPALLALPLGVAMSPVAIPLHCCAQGAVGPGF